jgi:hypothetical protein
MLTQHGHVWAKEFVERQKDTILNEQSRVKPALVLEQCSSVGTSPMRHLTWPCFTAT